MVSALAAFHFLRPALLWALVPFAGYALLLFFREQRGSPWARAVEPHLLAHLMHGQRLQVLVTPDVMLVPLGVLAVLAAAGPTWAPQQNTGDPNLSPLAIVVELSHSMAGTDVSPSRAERARLELGDLVHARPASPTALIVVGGSAHVLMPLTDDPSVLEPYLSALAPDLMPFDGEAFASAAKLLEPLAGAVKVPLGVLLVTDGIPPDGAAALRKLQQQRGVGFVVLAVGSGGDPSHSAPALDRSGLERFADDVGGEVIELSFGQRDVPAILHALALSRAHSLAKNDAEFWEDSAYLFALPLAVGIALWFRRGWVLGRFALFATLLFCTGCTEHIADIWLTRDQQGQILFDEGRYAEAGQRFEDPLRRGLALYAQSKWADAAAAFAAVDTQDGLYNLGNAYAQGGKLGSAVHAYERALAKSPTFRDARHNLDLVRELIAAQQEDTDKSDYRHAEKEHGDEATEVSAEQFAQKPPPAGSKERAGEVEATELSPAEQAAWLRHVATDPAEFLKRKLAVLAARGEQ